MVPCGAMKSELFGIYVAIFYEMLRFTKYRSNSNPSFSAKTYGLNHYTPKTARVSSGFRVFIPEILARFSCM